MLLRRCRNSLWGAAGIVAGRSPGIVHGVPYRNSADDALRGSFTVTLIPRRIHGICGIQDASVVGCQPRL